MFGLHNPRVRPYVRPGTRVTLGVASPNIPSPSHPVFGGGNEGSSDLQLFTPHGIFQAKPRVWHARLLGGQGMVSRAVTQNAQVPALFQMAVGVPNGFLPSFQVKNAAGRTGTPPVRHTFINPFPGVAIPTPSYPLPAAFGGSL